MDSRESGMGIPRISLNASSNIKKEATPKSLDLMKILNLLEDPLTSNLLERHLFVLKKLLNRNTSGFRLNELEDIGKIINICAEKVIERPKYTPFLCEILQISRLPFLKDKVSDDLIYTQDGISFFSCLGRLMKIPIPDIQERVVEMVQSLFSFEAPKDQPEDIQTVSAIYRMQLVEHSDLPKFLVESIATLKKNQSFIKLQLLETLQLLCSISGDEHCPLQAGRKKQTQISPSLIRSETSFNSETTVSIQTV